MLPPTNARVSSFLIQAFSSGAAFLFLLFCFLQMRILAERLGWRKLSWRMAP
jgi:hypothetical protein